MYYNHDHHPYFVIAYMIDKDELDSVHTIIIIQPYSKVICSLHWAVFNQLVIKDLPLCIMVLFCFQYNYKLISILVRWRWVQSTLKFRFLWSTISSSELGYQIFNDKYVYYLFKQNCVYTTADAVYSWSKLPLNKWIMPLTSHFSRYWFCQSCLCQNYRHSVGSDDATPNYQEWIPY